MGPSASLIVWILTTPFVTQDKALIELEIAIVIDMVLHGDEENIVDIYNAWTRGIKRGCTVIRRRCENRAR